MPPTVNVDSKEWLTEWRGKRVLLTGATGFIGRHVLRQAQAAGVEAHTISSRRASGEPGGSHRADLRDRGRVFQVVAAMRPQAIIHLAAAGLSYGDSDLSLMLHTNAIGTANLLAAARATGDAPRVVIAGSGFEYAPQDRRLGESDAVAPFSAYGVSKAAATMCAALYAKHLPITVLRLFSVYGPGEMESRLVPYLIKRSRCHQPVELTGGEQVRDYTFVEEVGESFWRALALPESAGLRVFNVGTGGAVTLKHLVLTLTELLREEGVEPVLHFGAKPYRVDEPMIYAPAIAALEAAFAWRPRLALREGLRRTLAGMPGENC